MLDRRSFLAACGTLPHALSGRPQEASSEGLRVELALKRPPDLPPPFELPEPPRAVVVFEGGDGPAQCSLRLPVLLGGKLGELLLAIWTADEAFYLRLREGMHLPAFRGEVQISRDICRLLVDGKSSFAAHADRAALGELTGPPPRLLALRYILASDWTQGPLDGRGASLVCFRGGESSSGRLLEPSRVRAQGHLDGWLSRLAAGGPVQAAVGGGSVGHEFEHVQNLSPSAMAPFAFRRFRGGEMGIVPPNPHFATPEDLAAYRGRRQTFSTDLLIVAIDSVLPEEAAQALLPPPCASIPGASARVMAVRGLEDPSVDEAWLFVDCVVQGRRAWYAAAHVRPALEGSTLGREVFGYPTRLGSMSAFAGGNRFAASVSRNGRRLFGGEGIYGGFSTGTSILGMDVATLRLKVPDSNGAPHGELLLHRWYYQGLRRPVQRPTLAASFADDHQVGPWNTVAESMAGRSAAHSAIVVDGAAMQRRPATVVASVPDPGPFYADRCGGRLPWEALQPSGAGGRSD